MGCCLGLSGFSCPSMRKDTSTLCHAHITFTMQKGKYVRKKNMKMKTPLNGPEDMWLIVS